MPINRPYQFGWSDVGKAIDTAAPYVAGGLATYGQIRTNDANRDIAREQMAFQERMSNTSAQRAVKDYEAAGLNPALAYDRGASSPSGSTATMGNAIAAGVSSAMAYKQMAQSLKIAKEQSDADLMTKSANVELAKRQGRLTELMQEKVAAEVRQTNQTTKFQEILQPFTVRQTQAQALLAQYLLPGAKNTADFETMLGKAGPGISTAKTLAEILKMLRVK